VTQGSVAGGNHSRYAKVDDGVDFGHLNRIWNMVGKLAEIKH
jgi:hypothetical protein